MTMPMTNNAALDGGRETVVQFDHLQHVYPGGVEALKDISLSFRKGEIVAIIGQNGSGKTTLSKHFNGLLRPTSGTVKVCGTGYWQGPHQRPCQNRGLCIPEPQLSDLLRLRAG